mmetsp:Transcript_68001/g.189915  ORF Transcript_68001/g.189915 Transcript_68001/m.189915 type:complete len:625 (+) Transcript_68001:98-1972(+)
MRQLPARRRRKAAATTDEPVSEAGNAKVVANGDVGDVALPAPATQQRRKKRPRQGTADSALEGAAGPPRPPSAALAAAGTDDGDGSAGAASVADSATLGRGDGTAAQGRTSRAGRKRKRPRTLGGDGESLERAADDDAPVARERTRIRRAAAKGGGEATVAGEAGALGAAAPARDGSATADPAARGQSGLFKMGTTFAKLGLARWLVEACENMGMSHPTDIQEMCIPPILAGRNVAGNAKTGSGKTACFCLPSLHHLSKDPYGVFTLVLTPVRELAFQISENFGALGKGIGVQVAEVVGGREMLHQSKMIAERKHVIVATPGRLADLLRGDVDLAKAFRHLRIFVLDEADRLLTPTFEEPLAEILAVLPKTRQTLLFSATITKSIEKLRSKLSGGAGTEGAEGKELLLLDANPNDETLANLTQQYVFVPQTVQVCYLHYLLRDHFADESCIVFAPTIEMCQLLTTMLDILEFPVTGLHSLQSQRERQASLGKFKSGRSTILIATDVAGRGLDIPKVGVVINIGLPSETDDYVHRAGRTARAGRPGLVVSLMTEHDVQRVQSVEERIGRELALRRTDEDAAIKLLSRTAKARQRADLLLSEVGFEDRVAEHREQRKSARGGAKRA